MNETATPARPPTLKYLEARAQKMQKARHDAWERVKKARGTLFAAMDSFHDALGHETAAFQALCAARQGTSAAPGPRPPAPETLTAADEED